MFGERLQYVPPPQPQNPCRIHMSLKCLQHHCLKKLDAEDKSTVTFAPSDRPPEPVVSDVTKSDSSCTPITQRGSVTLIAKNTDNKIKPDPSSRTNIRIPLSTGQYVFNVHFDNGPHDEATFFRKATCRVKITITIDIMSNALLTEASLLDTGP